MASPPILTPANTTGWNYTKISKTIEEALYQEMVMIPLIEEAERLYGGLTIRKAARVAGAILPQSAEGTGLTYVNPIGTPVALTPVGNYVAIGWSENEENQIDVDLDAQAVKAGTSALAEMSDQSVLANVPTLTNYLDGAGVTASMWYQAHGRLMGLTYGMAAPGKRTPQVYAVFTHKQYPLLGQINIFNDAEVRGGSETPYVDGIFTKGGGVKLYMSTVVANDVDGDHNVMFLARAFKVAWNAGKGSRGKVYKEQAELQHRVIVSNNFGSGIIHNDSAIGMRTTASAL